MLLEVKTPTYLFVIVVGERAVNSTHNTMVATFQIHTNMGEIFILPSAYQRQKKKNSEGTYTKL